VALDSSILPPDTALLGLAGLFRIAVLVERRLKVTLMHLIAQDFVPDLWDLEEGLIITIPRARPGASRHENLLTLDCLSL